MNRKAIEENGGEHQTGGCLWYKGKVLADAGAEHYTENLIFPIRQIHHQENQSTTFPYGFKEIDEITAPLGIPWETSKDVPFSSVITFAGLSWDLDQKKVSLLDSKKEKYRKAISEWRQCPTHTLEDTQKLYGKLLYACHIIP